MLRPLFATRPDEFVAARNELAKQLRRDKQRDEAGTVAALRRPGWDEWPLNVVAGEQPDVIAAFADAADAARSAQSAALEGREAADVRSALRALRDRTSDVVRAAAGVLERIGRRAPADDLTARLAAVATSDTALAQLRAGVLGSGDDAPGDLFAGLDAPPADAPARRSARARRSGRGEQARGLRRSQHPVGAAATATPAASATAGPDPAERRHRREALDDAQRGARAAATALANVDRQLHRASADVDAARRVLDRAQRALDDARARHADAAAAAEAAEQARAEASAALHELD